MTDYATTFNGFVPPEQNWSRLPNELIDVLPIINSMAEMKVILYVLRHTWGFQEFDAPKRITLDEFMSGRIVRGERKDRGTGLSKSAVIDGIERAVKHQFLIEYVDDTDKARIVKSYQLRMYESHTSGVAKSYIGGMKVIHRTIEKETLERNSEKKSLSAPLNATPTHAPQADSTGGQTEPNSVPPSKSIEDPLQSSAKVSPALIPVWEYDDDGRTLLGQYRDMERAITRANLRQAEANNHKEPIFIEVGDPATYRTYGSFEDNCDYCPGGNGVDFRGNTCSHCNGTGKMLVSTPNEATLRDMPTIPSPFPVVTYADAQREAADKVQGYTASLRAEMGKLLSERNPVTPPTTRALLDDAPDGFEWWFTGVDANIAHLKESGKTPLTRPLCKRKQWAMPNKCNRQIAYVPCAECVAKAKAKAERVAVDTIVKPLNDAVAKYIQEIDITFADAFTGTLAQIIAGIWRTKLGRDKLTADDYAAIARSLEPDNDKGFIRWYKVQCKDCSIPNDKVKLRKWYAQFVTNTNGDNNGNSGRPKKDYGFGPKSK